MLLFSMTLFFGFFVGAVTILAAEAFGILFIIRRLNRKIEQEEAKSIVSQSSAGLIELDPSVYNKQGVVWVLESERVPKTWLVAKGPREQKRKKDVLEVAPVRKYAKIEDQLLVLTESDNSHTKILLKGCIIAAVSATSLSSRKWAKRYPIKLESKTSVIYHESKTLYMYVETSWEKESWCKALRLASCDDKEKLNWFANLNLEFQRYLTSLNTGYPSFMKPSMGFTAESMDKSIKLEGSSSKVRHFLKKLAKKASKSGIENKATWSSTSGCEEKKVLEKSRFSHEPILATGLLKTSTIGKAPNCSVEENMVPSSLPSFPQAGSRSSVISEADSDDINFGDEGTLCWNLLISRLYFDAKSNAAIKSSILARIQGNGVFFRKIGADGYVVVFEFLNC
ncbi:unnamed protein product [Ilex paraguariensis]|uniref:SMP domain-containing protein n=1 Tax=Ilex paraguariensis TaxID=185542 RepID=A0ABC8T4K9_9AQUA